MFIENGDANEPPGALQTSASLLPPAPHIPRLSTDPDYWNLIYNMGNQIRYLRSQYPNLQQVFLHARIYAGYAQTTASNPEPFALEQSLAINALHWKSEFRLRGEGVLWISSRQNRAQASVLAPDFREKAL
jgi:hypothetical protein